jgi:hypothetical protein
VAKDTRSHGAMSPCFQPDDAILEEPRGRSILLLAPVTLHCQASANRTARKRQADDSPRVATASTSTSPASGRHFDDRGVIRISGRWVENPMVVVTSRFCGVTADGSEPGTVGYEPFSNRHQSQRATNKKS